MKIMYKAFLAMTAIALLYACNQKEENKPATVFSVFGESSVTLSAEQTTGQIVKFKTNSAWEIEIPSESSWIKVYPMSGNPNGSTQTFEINVSANGTGTRTGSFQIKHDGGSKKVSVNQSALHASSDFSIPQSMIFSTTLGRNTTNVAQGFDYDSDEDIIYITQKYGAYRNHIGWQKRETASSTTVAANYMTLACFSHGNNIAIQKENDGKKYVWAPNYATRQSDGSYDNPHIVSRFPLESGQTLYNTDTSENYYFGLSATWPAFDFKNDLVAVTNYKTFYIYKLSDLMKLPTENIVLDYEITYGGVVGSIDSKIPEWTGKPVVKAKDCRKVSPLYKVPFNYTTRGLHWQSYCIDNGWIYAILQADVKSAPAIMFDTYVEAYKMDGSKNLYKIRQEYMQNIDRILEFGWTDRDYFYCEPEGIKVVGDVMYLLYSIRGNDSHQIRRPVIFKLASPVQE